MRNARAYLPPAVLIVGCLLLWRAHSPKTMPPAAPLDSVMPEVSGLTTVQQVIGEQERRIAGMTDYVARAYRRDSAVVFTTLVSYYDKQVQGTTMHSPRNCLPGSGWEIIKPGRRQLVVDGSPHVVNSYLLKNGSTVALTYYWYQGRGRVVASEYAVKWNLLRDAALFRRTEEALVRVMVPVRTASASSDEESYLKAQGIGDQIATRLIREVNRIMPSMQSGGRRRSQVHGATRRSIRSVTARAYRFLRRLPDRLFPAPVPGGRNGAPSEKRRNVHSCFCLSRTLCAAAPMRRRPSRAPSGRLAGVSVQVASAAFVGPGVFRLKPPTSAPCFRDCSRP